MLCMADFPTQHCQQGNYTGNIRCQASNPMRYLQTCNNKSSCVFFLQKAVFDDPCPGIEKYMQIHLRLFKIKVSPVRQIQVCYLLSLSQDLFYPPEVMKTFNMTHEIIMVMELVRIYARFYVF